MTISNSRQSYRDCYEVWEKALKDPSGVRVKQDNEEAAVFFRMRMHQARKLHREDNAKTYPEGHPMHGSSPYDRLVARIRHRRDGVWIYLEHQTIDPSAIQSLADVIEADEIIPIGHQPVRTIEHKPQLAISLQPIIERIKRRV